jgi:hypothetical protein
LKLLKKRKQFRISTKKMEWMSAGGHDPLKWRTNWVKTSKCRKCHRILTWGDRSYDFDHKDNNPSHNSQSNCFLVCKSCHGKATKIIKIKTSSLFGSEYKTIKRKVSYKKPRKTKKLSRKKRKR